LNARCGGGYLLQIGTRPADAVNARCEERHRKIVGTALHVLRQTQKRRAAIRRIEHGSNSGRKRLQQLCRMSNAIPVARDRLERIVDRNGRVAKVFDLLQYRMRKAVMINVADRNNTGNRFACATAAAVTMFVAPGPIDEVATHIRRRP